MSQNINAYKMSQSKNINVLIVNKSERDKSLDVAKGLLMVSVVAGHVAYFPLAEIFYYYHVAGFFLLSGFFFNYDKYEHSVLSFFLSRKKIIMQYLCYSLMFIILHNLFLELKILPINSIEYTHKDELLAFVNSTTIPTEALLGAMWFIPVLIIMQVIFYFTNKINALFNHNKQSLNIVIVCLFFFGWWMVKSEYISSNILLNKSIPNAQFFVYLPFFYIGYLFKNYGLSFLKSKNIILPCLAIIIFTYVFSEPALYLYGKEDPYLFIFLSLISIASVVGLSHHVKNNYAVSFLKYIGENTVHILALHFISFKAASFLFITNKVMSDDSLHVLGTDPSAGIIQKMIYLLSGIFVPLLIIITVTKMKTIVFRKMQKRTLIKQQKDICM